MTAGLLLAGCGGAPPASAPPPSSAATTSAAVAPTTAGSPAPPAAGTPPTGTAAPVVVLDPGHNGGNARNASEINRKVPAGRGRTKPCNTTGTSTNGGYPEHAFNFDVARRVGEKLTAAGIGVVYTRHDDSGVGPCVDRRAADGNAANAAAVVSIHADGATGANAHGFHVAYSYPPVNAAQGAPSTRLARVLRDAMAAAGFPLSNYLGNDGLDGRDDLAGLNLSQRPAALVECGNMREAGDAAVMTSPQGRQRYADAIATAIERYLAG